MHNIIKHKNNKCNSMQYNNPIGYTPIELDNAFITQPKNYSNIAKKSKH